MELSPCSLVPYVVNSVYASTPVGNVHLVITCLRFCFENIIENELATTISKPTKQRRLTVSIPCIVAIYWGTLAIRCAVMMHDMGASRAVCMHYNASAVRHSENDFGTMHHTIINCCYIVPLHAPP